MTITSDDWCFEAIRHEDAERANRLEAAGSPEALIGQLVEALESAIASDCLRIAVDSRENEFVEVRPIIQFWIRPEVYDWFFNGRTGYRAQFWIAPERGLTFNGQVLEALSRALGCQLPENVTARQITFEDDNGTRVETDIGSQTLTRAAIVSSLNPHASKIWIGERLYRQAGGGIDQIGFATLSAAERSAAKLIVPRWEDATSPTGEKGQGLRAPFPADENSWLDIKGGIIDADGNLRQFKPQEKRARDIHECGWT